MHLNSSPQETAIAPLSPALVPELEENLELNQAGSELEELNAESVVEAAELLLREGAPHDFDVIVIGAGPGGIACAEHLVGRGRSVALIERDEIGGASLNKGCVPAKTLLESVGALRLMRKAQSLGVSVTGEINPDLSQMQMRKRNIIAQLRSQAVKRLEEAGVQILRGTARLLGENTLEIQESSGITKRLSAIHIVVATGGRPMKLPIEGADLEGVVTSDQILELESIPHRLIVLGAGAVGVELATIFAELGTITTIIDNNNAVFPGEDEDIQQDMQGYLQDSNIEVFLSASVQRIEKTRSIETIGESLQVVCQTRDGELNFEAEMVLMAQERKANIEDLGLEKAGIETRHGVIVVGEDSSTEVTGVWAIGDCTRRVGWAHQAALDGQRVAEAILGLDSQIDSRYVSTCYSTLPEVASVGITLAGAHEAGIEARAGRYSFRDNVRANISGDIRGFVKLVVEVGSGKLLGAQIIGPRAGELIHEIAVALRGGLTVKQLVNTIHAYPTFAEILEEAARDALT